MSKKKKFRRLFWDIETSPNLVFSWTVGPKVHLDYNSIVTERGIICICYKWEGESKVHHLTWNKGDDKQMLEQFVKVINSADESIGHNSDQYDLKWLRARCIRHRIPMFPDYQTVDTLKLSRKGFKFNSNRLDYIGQYLGLGKKLQAGFGLWKAIVLTNDSKAMGKMVKYCKQDVRLLEKVFQRLKSYVTHTTHVGVLMGKSNHSCPECGSTKCISNGQRITATGRFKQRLHCTECGKYHSINVGKND